MIKAIIFDLDNTLIDFRRFKNTCCEKAIEAMISAGLKVPKKKGMHILYELFSKYTMEDSKIFQRFLLKTTGVIDYKKLARAINAYRKARIGLLTPYSGVESTLKKLKEQGLKLAIVSDAPKLKAWVRLTAMKIDNYFDVVVALEDTGRLKPSRLPFRIALAKLNVEPSECIMVGDMPSRDMKGAKRLGMKGCHAKYGYERPITKKYWDYELNKISDLLNIVKI